MGEHKSCSGSLLCRSAVGSQLLLLLQVIRDRGMRAKLFQAAYAMKLRRLESGYSASSAVVGPLLSCISMPGYGPVPTTTC